MILLLAIITVLLLHGQRQNYEKTKFGSIFQAIVYRPIDIIHYNYFKKMPMEQSLKKLQMYGKQIIQGYKFLKNKKIVVCGLLYNAESQVSYLESWFEELKLICKDCVMVVVENNSVDETRQKCIQWRKRDPLHVHLVCVDTDFCHSDINDIVVDSTSPDSNRIRKMAFLRNCYVKYVQENFLEFDYVFVKDLDLQGHLFWDGIFHSFYCFKQSPKINVMTCNGVMRETLHYYDTFAYAKDKFDISWNFGHDKRNHDHDVLNNVSHYYQKNMELDKVASAFGGFAIYRMKQFKDKFYSYDRNRLSCEHCLYHLLYENVYLNPKMIFLIEVNKT